MAKSNKLKKALSITNLQNQKVSRIELTGKFLDAFGQPQDRGFWFVWGASASGKSSFMMQLANELAKEYKVLYNLLEEDPSDSDYIDRTKLFNMHDRKGNFLTASYTPEELDQYLETTRVKVVIIDSLVYFTRDPNVYRKFKEKYWKSHIIIFTGHAKGKDPKTKIEDDVMYDAKMKIFVSGYLASCKGRTIGKNGGNFIIYEDGYNKLRGAGASNELT